MENNVIGTYLGIDTSNYTSSAALLCEDGNVSQSKKLLPVAKGQLGLRQSDALFHHTKQLHEVVNVLLPSNVKAIGVSDKPRNVENSYMPCFLAGVNVAEILSKALNVPLYKFSHQQGHVAAALYSLRRLDLMKEDFLAFHLSGGTSEGLLIKNGVLGEIEIVSKTLDLNAGQVIDRVGQMLDLPFPSGKYIDQLASGYFGKFKIKPCVKENDFALSGVENLCKKMLNENKSKEEIAAFCLEYIILTMEKVIIQLKSQYPTLPIIFSGGVSSNSVMKKILSTKFNVLFAEPEFSADNAAGISVLTAYCEGKI